MDGRTGTTPAEGHCPHGTFWWSMKVLGAIALIACGAARFLLGWEPSIVFPILGAQVLVLIGGWIVLFHYWLLKRRRGRFDRPEAFLCRGGLFPLVRHPMYLGDAVMNLGFTLLAGSWWALCIYGFCLVALQFQAREEDRHLAERFPDAHSEWRRSSNLMWPRFHRLERWQAEK